MIGGRDTELYRIRRRELNALAWALEEEGYMSRIATPEGMPVLAVSLPGSSELRVVATISHGDVDWYRWGDHGADIAPCGDVDTTRDEVCRILRGALVRPYFPPSSAGLEASVQDADQTVGDVAKCGEVVSRYAANTADERARDAHRRLGLGDRLESLRDMGDHQAN